MSNWISVYDRLPEIIEEDGWSEEVLCVGSKCNNFTDKDLVEYEIMRWKKLDIEEQNAINMNGDKVLYGWSNRWWDNNPDMYRVKYWMPLPELPLK